MTVETGVADVSAHDVLHGGAPQLEYIHVSAWDAHFWLAPLSAKQRQELHRRFEEIGEENEYLFFAEMLIMSACNKSGLPLFDASHVEAILAKPSRGLHEIFPVIDRMNGISDAGADAIAEK